MHLFHEGVCTFFLLLKCLFRVDVIQLFEYLSDAVYQQLYWSLVKMGPRMFAIICVCARETFKPTTREPQERGLLLAEA